MDSASEYQSLNHPAAEGIAGELPGITNEVDRFVPIQLSFAVKEDGPLGLSIDKENVGFTPRHPAYPGSIEPLFTRSLEEIDVGRDPCWRNFPDQFFDTLSSAGQSLPSLFPEFEHPCMLIAAATTY
jgi:hypothetical protein